LVTPINRSRKQQGDFPRLPAQAIDIARQGIDLRHLHAALDPADEGALLVAGEIVPHLVVQDPGDGLPRLRRAFLVCEGACIDALMAGDLREACSHVLDRQRKIDETGRDCRLRHAALARTATVRALRQGQPAALLDRLDAERPIAAATGQDDANGARATRSGERAHEHVNGVLAGLGCARLEQKPPIIDRRHVIGGTDVDVVWSYDGLMLGIGDRHLGIPADDLGQRGRVTARHVGDHDKGHPAVGRHPAEKSLQGFQAAGRCAEADDREGRRAGHPYTSGLAGYLPRSPVLLLPQPRLVHVAAKGTLRGSIRTRRLQSRARLQLNNEESSDGFP
jgi:hypothetical protein